MDTVQDKENEKSFRNFPPFFIMCIPTTPNINSSRLSFMHYIYKLKLFTKPSQQQQSPRNTI